MSVGMKVFFYMLEPMSEEKMWIKKLDLGVQDFPAEYAVGREQYVTGTTPRTPDGCGGVITGVILPTGGETKALYMTKEPRYSLIY